MDDDPLALQAYEALAERFAALVETKPHNAHYDRPAVISLLPEVEGKRVLDAGCGPGVYAEWLLDRGAEVVALDASPKMVRLARERLGERATVLRADLGRPLDFLEDATFDLVLSALALDYVEDWRAVFAEFRRVLRPGGHLVFSVAHPFADFALHNRGDYFETERVALDWTGFGEPVSVPSYRRPLQAVISPLLETGFVLERLLEPTPTERFKDLDPREFERLSRTPGFLCVRAGNR